MQIKIKATNTELTDAISSYIYQKMGDIDKFIKTNDPESVLLSFEIEKTTRNQHTGLIHRAEANLTIDGKYFRAESSQEDIYAAIDEVKDEIISGVKSYQNKQHTLLRKGGAKLKDIIKGLYRGKK